MSFGIHPVSTAETGYGNVRYTANMKCAACGDPLPSGKKASARYCDDDCRSAAARSRARNRAKRAKQIDSQSDGNDAPAEPRPAKQTRRLGSRIPRTNIALSCPDRADSVPTTTKPARPSLDYLPSPRIDIKVQILRQAPPDAVGYGIVLPATSSDARPKIIPRRKKGKGRTPYRLSPFDYPLDIRLHDATWYRILWFGEDGEQVPSPPDSGIPSLYFFLGTPDRGSMGEFPSQKVLDSTAQEATADDKPKLPGVSTVPPQALPAIGDSGALSTLMPDDAASESLATHANEAPSKAESSVVEYAAHLAELASASSYPSIQNWTIDSLAQCVYEQRVALARMQGQTPPPEPLTQMSSDERKKIRRMAQHPFIVEMTRSFVERFESIYRVGIDRYVSQPMNTRHLKEFDRRLMHDAQTAPDKRNYVEFLLLRAHALLSGASLPIEPQTNLTAQERQRIRKVVLDVDSFVTMFGHPDVDSSV